MLDNITLERHLKKFQLTANILSLVIGLVTASGIGYAFYYKTTNTLDTHTLQIEEVKADVQDLTVSVNNSAIFQGASKEQIKSLENQVADVKKTQDRIEDKIDKLIMRDK
jgi:hypothetical protein